MLSATGNWTTEVDRVAVPDLAAQYYSSWGSWTPSSLLNMSELGVHKTQIQLACDVYLMQLISRHKIILSKICPSDIYT